MMDNEQDAAKEARAAYDIDDLNEEVTAGAALEQYIVDREGNRVGVILPFAQYEQMKEDLQGLREQVQKKGLPESPNVTATL